MTRNITQEKTKSQFKLYNLAGARWRRGAYFFGFVLFSYFAVKFFVEKFYVQPISNIFRRVETRGNKLYFHQIEVLDAGKYVCVARNRIANTSSDAEVVVNGKWTE